MKTGVLKRIWCNGTSLYKKIKGIVVIISIIIAIISTIFLVTNTYGSFKNEYAYNKAEYIALENLLKATVKNDPYLDLKSLNQEDIQYTCNYDSESNNWEIKISKGTVEVEAYISYENGTYNVKTVYDNKFEYVCTVTIVNIYVLALISIVAYFAIAAMFYVVYIVLMIIWCVIYRIKKSR